MLAALASSPQSSRGTLNDDNITNAGTRTCGRVVHEHSAHVVMTATITANQKKWKPAPEPQLSRAESPPAADGLPFYDSIDDVLGELDLW